MKTFLVRASEPDMTDAIEKIQKEDPAWDKLIKETAGGLRKYMLTASPEFAGDIEFEQSLCAAFLDDVLEDLFPGYKD